MPIKVDAFIISWPGKHDRAAMIARGLRDEVDRLTVLYPRKGEDLPDASWQSFPDEWYFGRQFRHMIETFSGDVLLHVMADVHCDDWPGLVRRLRNLWDNLPDVGIWSPEIDYTSHTLERTSLGRLAFAGVHAVVHTDETVWALSREIVEQMRGYNYASNNLGWGIDIAAAFRCHATQRLVVVDTTVKILHPHTTSYDQAEAGRQGLAFFRQIKMPDKLYFLFRTKLFVRHYHWRRFLYWISRSRRLRRSAL